jgi:hypothetical protein
LLMRVCVRTQRECENDTREREGAGARVSAHTCACCRMTDVCKDFTMFFLLVPPDRKPPPRRWRLSRKPPRA